MKKENVVDFSAYRNDLNPEEPTYTSVSEELEIAIQNLIYRLRELGPLPQ